MWCVGIYNKKPIIEYEGTTGQCLKYTTKIDHIVFIVNKRQLRKLGLDK